MRAIQTALCILLISVTASCTKPGGTGGGSTSTSPIIVAVTSPETQVQLAHLAGGSAATIYIVTQQPPVDQVVVLRAIIDQINASAGAVPAGGFITLQSKFNGLIDAQVSNALGNMAAKELVAVLLQSLDAFLASHADWNVNATQAASIVSSFCSGASAALADYKAKGLEEFKRARGVTVEYSTPATPSPKTYPVIQPLVNIKDGCLNGRCQLKH